MGWSGGREALGIDGPESALVSGGRFIVSMHRSGFIHGLFSWRSVSKSRVMAAFMIIYSPGLDQRPSLGVVTFTLQNRGVPADHERGRRPSRPSSGRRH